jgi:hypothetical protein
MTTTADLHTDQHDRSDDRLVAAAAGLLAYAVSSYFTWTNAHDTREIMVSLGLAAVVSLVVFGWFVPVRLTTGAPAAALGFGIAAALLAAPAFWSGLPLIFGVAGILLGRASSGKRAVAGMVLSALAVAFYLYLYVVMGMVQGQL